MIVVFTVNKFKRTVKTFTQPKLMLGNKNKSSRNIPQQIENSELP